MKRSLPTVLVVTIVLAGAVNVLADLLTIDFESFTLGSVHGQDGWSMTGAYDVAIVSNTYGYASFGGKSLRISNAVTSGSFGDWVFSKSLADEAGETSAASDGYSGGTRQVYFEAEWDFASTVPTMEQPGLQVSASPDRGDGARMSFIRMKDSPSGLLVEFADYQTGLSAFVVTTVASGLDRSVPHRIKLTMEFIDGVANDVVKVYVDGSLVHTGTSWEDYFRDVEGNPTRPVDSIIIQARSGGGTAPATLGFGFVIDNLRLYSGPSPCTTDCYVDAATGSDLNGGTNPTTDAKKTIQNAVNTVNASGNVHVASGTYTEQVTINKSLNLIGADASTTIIKAPATLPPSSMITSTVVDIDGSGITVDIGGFTVSGPGPTGCGSMGTGILVRGGAHADIHDNKILDVRDEPISGCQNGVGIQVGRKLYSTTGTATITNNEISGYQKNGITVDNAGSYAEISGNTITGAGAVTFIAQNGIQISRGATGEINGNTVSGHSYTPFTFVSTGMLLYQADANTDDNDVLENQVGLYHIEGSGLHQKNEVSASAAGTGSPFFWGIVADPGDVPRVLPEPLDGLATNNNAAQSKKSQNTIAATYTSVIDQNVLTGDGSASGIGLEGDALGTDVLDFTATGNTITGWAVGITFYKDPGATLIANVIDCNKIYDNAFGLDNPTGVVVNAVGNWWGDATGPTHLSNPGGSGDEVSDDVTFTPWQGSASCGSSIGNDLVFHAGGSISIERTKQTPSRGWIHSNGTVTFKRGDPSTYEVDITAVGKVTIVGDENTIDGDVFTAGAIANNEGSIITGAAISGAAISSMALPSLSYSAGGPDHTIAKGKSLTLSPGSYGTVTINKTATLKLSSGAYYFTKLLNGGSDATIIFDVSGGPITINVVTSLTIAKDMEFRIVPDGESGSEKVTVNTMQSAKLSIGAESYLLGDLNAPYAAVSMGKNTQYRGTLRASTIEILRDCLWYGHNSTGTLPGPDLLPKFEAEDETSDQPTVISYQLAQNYPNPFNPSTLIRFGLVERGNVQVQIYNHLGQVVRTLAEEEFAAGWHELSWDGRNQSGEAVASGVYFYRLTVQDGRGATVFAQTRRMTFLK
jgi:hypothetical protein